MKRVIVACALFGSVGLSTVANAQPVLDRVEQSLREQVPRGQPPAPGAAEPGYLGITADDHDEQGRGVRVVEVVAGGPAAQGGLQVGDLITTVDGQPIRQMEDMGRLLMPKAAGANLNFTINREGTVQQQQVVLGPRPASRPFGKPAETLPPQPGGNANANTGGPKLGVRTIGVSQDAAREHHLRDANGAQVVSIAQGSAAERASIPLGVVIVAVDGQAVDTPHQLTEAVKQFGAKGEIEVIYIDHGRETRKQVRFDGAATNDQASPQFRARPPQPPMPMPEGAPILPMPSNEDARVNALEAQVRQLQARIEKLEARSAGEAN